ncbi:MAG TPA: NACHT domain-containing protein, partial [Bryobacteraceae bacterium]|nr:NACHT domain-containing protein [Bryobacteraceae bacterium]
MPIQPVIHSVLKNLANTLIGKAPGAAYEKWLADGQTRSDIETAWNEAMERALAENSAFGALVDQQQLSKVIVEHSLDPYWLFDPDREQIWDAGSLRWIQTEQAKVAAEKFLEHFLDSWKRRKSFAARAQLYEQLRQNKLLETIRDVIASAVKDGIPIKTAPGYAPAASLLSEYCGRVAAGHPDQFLVDRKVRPKTLTTMRTAALAPVSLEEVFAEYDRIVLLGQGGLGKTRALRRREQDLAARYQSGAGVCVPVYLKLSEYRGGSIERLVADRINNVLKGSGLRLAETADKSERVAQAWLEQGGRSVEILFDGLNETPESLVAELRTHLEDFLRYEQRVVLTSREHEIDPLPGGRIPAFVLTPLTRAEIETLLVRTLAGKGEGLRSRLASDSALAGLLSNPFLLGLVTELVLNSPEQTLPGNRALLMRASVSRIRPALRQEGRTGGAAARSGVVDEFLKELGWKMLRTGVVSANYSAVYSWNL